MPNEPLREGFQGEATDLLDRTFHSVVDSMLGGIQERHAAGDLTNSCQLVLTHPKIPATLMLSLTLIPTSMHGLDIDTIREAVDRQVNGDSTPKDVWS